MAENQGSKSLWVLEDDTDSQDILSDLLASDYKLKFFDGVEPFSKALSSDEKPDLVLADLRLGNQNFNDWLSSGPKRLNVPFIVVSAVDDQKTLRELFEAGARDYLLKPFRASELMVKIERALSGNQESPKQKMLYRLDNLGLKIVVGDRQSAPLTSKEFQLMSLFLDAPDNRLLRTDIVQKLWNGVRVSSKTLDVHLFNLRKKTEVVGLKINFIAPLAYEVVKVQVD